MNLLRESPVEGVDETTMMNTSTPGGAWIRIAGLVPALVLLVGCFAVRIKENVRDPQPYFEIAYERIQRIHRDDPQRKGHAGEVRLLIYDLKDRDLIRIEAPFWLVNMSMNIERKAHDPEDYHFEDDYEFDWRKLQELKEVGPGLLGEVEDEGTWMLVWIE